MKVQEKCGEVKAKKMTFSEILVGQIIQHKSSRNCSYLKLKDNLWFGFQENTTYTCGNLGDMSNYELRPNAVVTLEP